MFMRRKMLKQVLVTKSQIVKMNKSMHLRLDSEISKVVQKNLGWDLKVLVFGLMQIKTEIIAMEGLFMMML